MASQTILREADYNEGHAASLAISSEISIKEPLTFRDPDYFDPTPFLNQQEIKHFKKEGFIVKRQLIKDEETFQKIKDHIWANVPRSLMKQNNPQTWIEPPENKWTESDSLKVGHLKHRNWKIRSKGSNGLGTEDFLVKNIANSPNMLKVVESLIGSPVRPPKRVRGIYCVFPSKPGSQEKYNVHVDYIPSHVTAMVIADQIRPGCGGFMLWPGSHIELHRYWNTAHGGGMDHETSQKFLGAREKIIRGTTPVEFTGSAGDVIFWHPRAIHSAGSNRSAEHSDPLVRVIIPCDFQLDGLAYVDDEKFGPSEDYQWWIDTRNFEEDMPPNTTNIWNDWAI